MAANSLITDRQMADTKPGVRDIWLTEPSPRGVGALAGRITPGGKRIWYFRYSRPGAYQDRLRIGEFKSGRGDGVATFSVAQARAKVSEWNAIRNTHPDLRNYFEREQELSKLRQDNDLRNAEAERLRLDKEAEEAERAAANRVTVRMFFDTWCSIELKPRFTADGKRLMRAKNKPLGRKDAGLYVRQQFERHVFPFIGDRILQEVVRADIKSILVALKERGTLRTASVVMAGLRQMFKFAIFSEHIQIDPMLGLSKAALGVMDTERERVLNEAEIRHLGRLLPKANLAPRTQCAIVLALATAARVGELVTARWEHVDLLARTWYLPTSKNQRDHLIYLSNLAVRQFERLAELRENYIDEHGEVRPSPWVFPATNPRDHLDVKTIQKQVWDRQRLSDDTGKPLKHRSQHMDALALVNGRWTMHDLRRSAATWMDKLGVSRDVIDECLNHVIESSPRRTYVRNRLLPEQARAFDALGAKLDELLSGRKPPEPSKRPEPTNVVPLRA